MSTPNLSGVGANVVPTEVSEAIADIPRNRTMYLQQFTADAPPTPDVVHGIKSMDAAFEHFSPEVNVEFSKADGTTTEETLQFRAVKDFSPASIKQSSKLLSSLGAQQDLYTDIAKQLKSNKLLSNVLGKDDTKQAMLGMLQALIQELKDTDQPK